MTGSVVRRIGSLCAGVRPDAARVVDDRRLLRAASSAATSRTSLTSLREASLLAHRLGHPYAGTTHLLGTLLTEANSPAARLLYALDVDVDAVRADTGSRLSAPPAAGATAH